MLANDHYFRGINLRYGPDGSVYLIDWYDKNACHRTNPEIWDRSNGRIYRISYGTVNPQSVNVHEFNDAQLIAAHEHRNEWFTRMARKTLMERGMSEDVKVGLIKRAIDVSLPVESRLRYLWTLHACGAISEAITMQLLSDKEEYVRAWAIQLELEDKTASDAVVKRLQELAADDKSATVRLYLSSALQRLPNASRWGIATALAAHGEDAKDHNLPLMIWYGTEPLVADDPKRAIELALKSQIPLVREYIFRRVAASNESLPAVVAALGDAKDATLQREILEEMMASFEGRVDIPMPESWKSTYDALLKSDQEDIRDKANQLAVLFGDQRVFPPMRSLLGDAKQDIGRRQQALAVLVKGQDKSSADVLLSDAVLGNAELQAAAVKALATLGNEKTPTELLKRFSKLPASVKGDAVSTLVSRPAWTKILLTSIGSGDVPSSELHAYHVRQILRSTTRVSTIC